MNITYEAIKKNRITAIILLLILAGGINAYFHLPRDEDPGFVIRTALVLTYFPGASPSRVEQLVSDKLEKSIQEIPELDSVESISKTGVSIIYVNIKDKYTDMRPIWDGLRRKVKDMSRTLPEGIYGPYVNDEYGDVFGTVMTITGEGFSYKELKKAADEVRDELLRLSEVAKVDIYGAQDERIFVEFNNARLADLGMSPYHLKQILESRNIIIPGGAVLIGNERIVLEPSGNFESIDDLKKTVINVPGRKELLFLGDISRISKGYIDPPETIMRSSGVDCLGLAVSMRDGGNIITLGKQVKELYNKVKSIYPVGIEFDMVAFQPDIVENKVNEFVDNVLESMGIVLGVILLLLGLRTGLIVASLIPMAMIMTLFVMSWLGIGLDQMSLAALIIALGMLVDNAIVMAESIMVQMSNGKKVLDAAVDSGAA